MQMGLLLPLRVMPLGGACSTWERWLLSCGEQWHRDPCSYFFSSLSRASNPRFSSTVSPWQIETLLLFIAGWYMGLFPICCYRLGRPTWGLDLTHFKGNPSATEISIPLELQLLPWEPSQPFCASSELPTSLIVVNDVLGYKPSLQLVFSWLYRMIII